MRTARSYLTIGVLAAGLAACASHKTVQQTSEGDVVSPVAQSASLVVRNDNFSDMNVFVVSQGQRLRLGMVTGNSTMRFRIPAADLTAGQVDVVASRIGGSGLASTGTVNVNGGQTIQFTIAPVLSQSSVEVR